ncbi:MAG: hypothetical protein JG766_2411 [Desulfacinum sp.]|jgi:uncharacterized protein YutE (UPF0331/DUF86 family)|nr:hypothetical protein [Desulfacinum sp.]
MERIFQKAARIRQYLQIIETLKPDCPHRFMGDSIYRGALLHYLYLTADSCIALAQLIIKHRGLRPPQSYAEAFDILAEGGILDPAFAYDFAQIAGFRNFLAHDYEDVDPAVICGPVLDRMNDVALFLHQVTRALGEP